MELVLDDDQQLFLQTARRFLDDHHPITSLRARLADRRELVLGTWRTAAELGWTAALVPEAHGGGSVSGSGLRDLALVAEAMAPSAAPLQLVPVSVVLDTLGRHHRVGAIDTAITSLVSGDSIAAWAHDEGRGSWDVTAMQSQAMPSGGGWILNGSKCFVEEPELCTWLLVSASTPNGISQFLVPADAPGVTISPRVSLDLGRGVGDVRFENVAVGQDALVGEEGHADADIEQQLLTALVLLNAETAGVLDHVLAITLAYIDARMAFGRPLSSYQALKHRCADMKMWVEACLATSNAATAALADGAADAIELVLVASSYIAAMAPGIVQDCIQLHGGIGVTWEHDLHIYLRRVTQNVNRYGSLRHRRERLALAISPDQNAS